MYFRQGGYREQAAEEFEPADHCATVGVLGEWSTSRKNISLEKARAGRSRCVENRGFASRRVSQPMSGREIRQVVRVQMLSSSLIVSGYYGYRSPASTAA